MQLIRHLDDEELTELLLEGDRRELQDRLSNLPASLRSSTEHPEWFWQKQQAAIGQRIAAARNMWVRPLTAWASALALVIVALLLFHGKPTPKPAQARVDPDQQLLVSVEDAVGSEVPDALEPAALLADEITNNARAVSAAHRSAKENRNED